MAQAAAQEVVQVEHTPVIVAPATKRARVKGTWTMYYGSEMYDFVDGQYYDLSPSLFSYLKQQGNIYDTMA